MLANTPWKSSLQFEVVALRQGGRKHLPDPKSNSRLKSEAFESR